ncbi:hypothetical protein IMCC21224_113246 [Puniceibacterium sp. IMCC21224]|nr:hypothetical protein IMCC21224_113246 [Puniceibacterium sp. IMCC21224]
MITFVMRNDAMLDSGADRILAAIRLVVGMANQPKDRVSHVGARRRRVELIPTET